MLKDGVVAEQGTHDELIAQNGVYAELHHIQFETRPPRPPRQTRIAALAGAAYPATCHVPHADRPARRLREAASSTRINGAKRALQVRMFLFTDPTLLAAVSPRRSAA